MSNSYDILERFSYLLEKSLDFEMRYNIRKNDFTNTLYLQVSFLFIKNGDEYLAFNKLKSFMKNRGLFDSFFTVENEKCGSIKIYLNPIYTEENKTLLYSYLRIL